MGLLYRYSGLKQRMIGERFGGLDDLTESRVSHLRAGIACWPAKNYRDYLWPICFSSFSQYSTSFSYLSVVSPCSGRQRLNGCSFVALPY